MPSRPGSRLALVLALLAPLACGGRLLRTQLEPSPEARGQYLPVPVDAVRELPAPTAGPGWHERVTDVVGGPYELLASITTLGAGAGGAEQARASLRRRVAELGGDAMLVREVVREPSGPYTRADGLALKLLPPMPDAGERCDALVHPDSAGARVIACREAVRQRPGDEARRRHLLVAHVALMDEWERRNDGPRARDAWMSAARAIGDAYGRARDASPDAPWVRELVQHRRGDTTRAYGLIAGALHDVHGPPEGALAAGRQLIRLAPDSLRGYDVVFEQLHRAGRQREALAVAAAFARQRPDRAEGWDRAAYAAHHLGDHVLAMRLWGRVLAIEPRHFSRRIDPPRGWLEHRESRKRAGAQPPATLQDLPPAS